jgi:integrase
MSVYKSPKSPFYSYDFRLHGRRFFGTTKAKSRKAAEAVERGLRAKARADVEAERRTGNGPLTLDIAAGRYWQEVGQHHAGSANTWRDLERLLRYFGKGKRLDQITDADVAALVAWRRGQTLKGRAEDKDGRPVAAISPSTVNRSTTAVLKKVFTRAKRTWRYTFPLEPNWRDHWLKEPQERVRELHAEEGGALDVAIRQDYAPWLEFARLTGLRRGETLIRWSNVNWASRTITTPGKGGRMVSTPITPAVAALLEPLKGHHDEFVFTFTCKRTRGGHVKGQRYPITIEGAKTEWRRTRTRAGLADFRFHDIRHDVATKTLRATGNLKLVQKVLNHRSIATTTRYAHILDEEVAEALELVAKSRKKSRNEDEQTK